MNLRSSQKRYLRGLAHALRPVVLIGAKGVTAAVVQELKIALDQHELVKVKLADDDRSERSAQIAALAAATNAMPVQIIGRVACLYRRNADQPKLTLPT